VWRKLGWAQEGTVFEPRESQEKLRTTTLQPIPDFHLLFQIPLFLK
jgi:hypothetical protein